MTLLKRSISITEVLVASTIMLAVSALIGLEFLQKRSSDLKMACADNMRRAMVGLNLYMRDNDGAAPDTVFYNAAVWPYTHTSLNAEYCPERKGFPRGTVHGYLDMLSVHNIYRNIKPVPDRHVFGVVAPEFDPEYDAILKCFVHATDGFEKISYTPKYLLTRSQTVYLDGHVRDAFVFPCWEIPWQTALFSRHPDLVRDCDGTLSR